MHHGLLGVRAAVAVLGTVLALAPARAGDWPMWRHDAGRTAASPDGLPGDLGLLWSRDYPPREPVWDDPLNRDLMPYDSLFEPVVAGKRMFVAFNDGDKLVCLDTGTGVELWTFHADGPVRLPPVASRGKVYLASDDGRLYCLGADSGELAWRHEGAPTARKALGNKRLISSWPARGGPVVSDGVVYYAAGIWPFMGTFICALDAGTGRVRWLNDSTGAQYIKQPHRAPAFAGVAPQGAFVVAGGRLLVPGGRSVPACFDIETGDQIYYRLAENQKTGGSFVCALGRHFFNHYRERVVNMYDLETGNMLAKHVGRHPVLTEGVCYFSGDSVRALDTEALARDPKRPEAAELWRVDCDATGDLIRAGDRLYAAGGAAITAIDVTDGGRRARVAWTKKAGPGVGRLLAADGKLFAVTLDGKILAFGSGGPRPGEEAPPGREDGGDRTARRRAGAPSAADVRRARRILDEAGVTEGYALVWGFRNPGFLEALAAASRLHIVAVSADARTVDAARRHLDDRGLYGRRVAVHEGDPVSFMAPPYVASLSVVVGVAPADARAAGGDAGRMLERAYRSVRPYGGVLYCEDPRTARSAARLAREGRLPGAESVGRPGATVLRRKGPLAGSAAWTHQYGDCANTVKSDDTLVKLPLGVLWFGGCSNMDVLPRHGHGPPEQVIGGRLFIEGIDLLSARDVYTGRVLWKSEFDDLGNFGVYYDGTYKDTPTSTSYNQVHLPGANARGANFVATEDEVYVAHGKSCRVLDAATGETVREIPLPRMQGADDAARWAYIGVYGDILLGGTGFVPFATTAPFKVDKPSSWTEFDRSASRGLVAMDRRSGDVKWRLTARHGFLHNGIAAGAVGTTAVSARPGAVGTTAVSARPGAGKVFCLDRLPPFVEANLRRRGRDARGGARLIALDAATGRALWTKEDVFGTWLGYSEEHDVLIQAGRPSRDMVKGEGVGRMAGLRGRDGKTLWEERREYGGPCIIHGDRIVTAGRMFSLLTGERVARRDPLTGKESEWVYKRTYGCNYNIGAEHLLTFRSGAAGFYDLATDGGTGNFGGFKSGCTSNLVAADGVLNAPDYTRTCSCSYQNQTSLALVHDPDVEFWTTFASKPAGGRIRRVGINLGAPGDRRDEKGTYWVEYPLVGGPSPEVAIAVKGDGIGYFRHHSSRMSGDGLRWVAASGVRGAAKIEVSLGDPGAEAAGGYVCRKGADDAEESEAGGVSLRSSDLELIEEKSRQTVGIRFAGVELDRAERLAHAYVQFQVDEKSTAPAELVVRAEASDDAAAFRANRRDISSRRRTARSVTWRPEPWGEVGACGPGQRTPDISAVVAEVIGRPGWRRGGAIVLIVTGRGKRVAEAFDGDSGGAPRLVVRTEREDRERLRARGAEPSGRYTVRLHFAEPEDAAPGERVFDVSLQGKRVLRGLDIAREAGGVRRPVVRTFRGVGVRDVLEIGLGPSRAGRPPVLCGIELVAE